MCYKAFSRSDTLNIHMRSHTDDKPYKCSLCDKSFSESRYLQTHQHSAHSNSRPYLCSYCGKTFTTDKLMKHHVRIHTGAKQYSCEHCSERFARLDKLETHLLKSHSQGTWFIYHIYQEFSCSAIVCNNNLLLQHCMAKVYGHLSNS